MNLTPLGRQRGLSLIELMIAILLSAMLLWGVLQIFDSNRNTMRMQTAFARVQESGRFAMDLLARQIRIADYWGCAPDPGSIRNHLDTSDPDYVKAQDYLNSLGTQGILGTDDASGVTIGTKDVIDGTDILYLRGSEDACGGTGRMVPSSQAASIMASQNCQVAEGQTILLTNCQSGELMTITNVQTGGGGSSLKRTLVHNTGSLADGYIENATKDLQREYGADSRILVPYQRIYFIANNDTTNTPSLFVSEDSGSSQELIPGIEDLQILYGFDTDNDDVVDTWKVADTDPNEMENVLALKVQLVAASDSGVNADDLTVTDLDGNDTTYSDGKLRKVYLTTTKIRNRGQM
ncbi:PilW family protein [Microbulbifer sp. SAOS-129_SWC]|uniref:PilW family protein n=1 Tax=Microbulbifer sp. SAOS-129_SWC TaxID=3145235 RepID=UPI0032175995